MKIYSGFFARYVLIALLFCGIPGTVSSVAANSAENSAGSVLSRPLKGWLDGTWSGTAYQSNAGTYPTWTMKLTASKGKYTIDYPSLSCGGQWKLTSMSANKATFKESITDGLDKCTNNGTVTILRLSKDQVVFWYSDRGQKRVTAIAVLDRQ